METDIDLMMGAAGLRGVVVQPGEDGGLELAATTDAMAVRTSSEAVRGSEGSLAAAEGDVTRLRLGLEGNWHGIDAAGGSLVPSLEVGLRHDGGDAETGLGMDIGAGLAWSDPRRGIEAKLRARGLLTHEAGGFSERGVSGALTFDPAPSSERGLRLTLTQTMGAAASGGMDALLGRETLAGLAANDDGEALGNRRLEATLGYGLPVLGGAFIGTPQLGFALSETSREYRLGWGLAPSALAARTLSQEAGIASETLQLFLARNAGVAADRMTHKGEREMRAAHRNTALIVDEGSLASTVQAHAMHAGNDAERDRVEREQRINDQAYFALAWGQLEAEVDDACEDAIRQGQSHDEWKRTIDHYKVRNDIAHGALLSHRIDVSGVIQDFFRIQSSLFRN